MHPFQNTLFANFHIRQTKQFKGANDSISKVIMHNECSSQGHDHLVSSFLTTLPAASLWTLWGGALLFLSSLPLTLTILEWMAQEMQYCILMQSLGMMQVSKALFSSRSFLEEASTISRMVKRLTALSLGQSLPQLTHTMVFTKPLLFLFLPWFLRLTGMLVVNYNSIYLLKLINIQHQQLTMIKNDFRSKINNQPQTNRVNRSPSINRKSKSNRKDQNNNKNNPSSNQKREALKTQKIGSFKKTIMKENKPINQNTPKNMKMFGVEGGGEEVMHMESIKFISKQCSSIKENHNDDCISFSNSGNNLDQFSPLFDKIEKESSSKQDFTLQIYGIEDSDSYYQLNSIKDISFNEKPTLRQQGSHAKSGRIKKNKITSTISSQKPKKLEFEGQILQIFKTLDHFENHILSKQNCASEKLSTELNYLIGSILNKIKVKSKQYDYLEFEDEFKSLIQDSEKEEILQILENNRKKRIKLCKTEKDASIDCGEKNIFIQQPIKGRKLEFKEVLSPQFKKVHIKQQVSQKLNKISSKLNNYLAKNNLQFPTKPLQQANHDYPEQKQPVFTRQSLKESMGHRNRHETHYAADQYRLKTSKSTQKHTLSTQNSNVSCTNTESIHKSHISLKNNVQIIKKIDGSAFELNFTELNKHLD